MAHIRTFKNIQDEVLAWLDEAGDTDSTLTLAKQAIQAAHEQRLTQAKWPFMIWEPTETFSLVVGTQIYSLHSEFLRPLTFRNRTSGVDLTEVFDHNVLHEDWASSASFTGKFSMWSRAPVANQPSSASALTISSSSGSDTTAQVQVRGDTADGVTTETWSVATGVSTTSFTRIINVTKIGTWIGTMTMTSNAAAVTNLKLFAAENGRSYQRLQLIGSPSTADVIEYRFYRQPSPLVLDNDIPDIPAPFQELLVWDTLLSFSAYNEYDPTMVGLWTDNRDKLLLALQQSLTDMSVGASCQYVDYIPR